MNKSNKVIINCKIIDTRNGKRLLGTNFNWHNEHTICIHAVDLLTRCGWCEEYFEKQEESCEN